MISIINNKTIYLIEDKNKNMEIFTLYDILKQKKKINKFIVLDFFYLL